MQNTASGNETAAVDKKVEIWPLGHLSIGAGLATAIIATGAAAQQATLPPVDVEAKKSAPKAKAKAKAAPAPVQQAAPVIAAEPSAPVGPPVSPPNALEAGTGIGRLPGTLQDTPQTVNVVSQQQIKEQNITSLDQALRSVPGVTVALGEGGGGMNGDQFRIRGFQAKGDIYVDGLRDFGVYVRDSFAYEQVQVIKGPSSESFGMGTTGGAINVQQKTAHLGDAASIEQTIGMGPMYRSTVDINKQIDATTAVRVVGMWTDQDIVDRDHIFNDRWGVLASVAFGLGTDTTLTLNYLHQEGDRKPDMGVPIVTPPAAFQAQYGSHGRPITEVPGVSRSNFYGKSTDADETTVDMLTARLTHKVHPGLTIHNDSRLAFYSRYFAQTVTSCSDSAPNTCATDLFDGDPATVPEYAFGGPAGFDQESWGAQNITTAVAKFRTGEFRHEAVAGVDVFYQHDERTQLRNYTTTLPLAFADKNGGSVYNPVYEAVGYYVAKSPNEKKRANSTGVGLFASDRMWLTPEFSILGGVRWDYMKADYWASAKPRGADIDTPEQITDVEAETSFVSPKASVIWEPTKNQTYYVSWARSYSGLAGQFITNDNTSVGDPSTEPEENTLWEVGAKYSLFGDRLGLTAALFRVDKTNARVDDGNGNLVDTGEKQRVQGVELGVTGKLTDAWTVQAAYTYLDSEVLNSASDSTVAGNRVAFVPKHAASIWSTVELSKLMYLGPGKAIVGAGITYADDLFANSANTSIIPEFFSVDGLISYEIDSWRVALNGYNLTDELNYVGTFGNRAEPSPGRTVLLTIGKKF